MIERRLLLTAAVAAFAGLPARARAAPEWPNKPLRFIVGFSAGSKLTVMTRYSLPSFHVCWRSAPTMPLSVSEQSIAHL